MAVAVGVVWLIACAHGQSAPTPAAEDPARGDGMRPPPTSAVATVEGEELDGRPAKRLEELLEGRVAGVQVLRMPEGGIAIRIRGPGSIAGDNEPLYVIDGMPVRVAAGHGLYWLNPSDVERIEILKDAGAISIYGMRGANGVVLITTRHGKRKR